MTWEEAVDTLRNDPTKADLVRDAYFSADLSENVEAFLHSAEFQETLLILKENQPDSVSGQQTLLDVGAGNGIASLAFALNGFEVTAIEPDKSLSVGSGAIRSLAKQYGTANLSVEEAFMEDLDLPSDHFDIVYGRQVMHHAYDLDRFAQNCYRVVKPGGLLLTVRDHVVKNPAEKLRFLNNHPLHDLYGGENAFALSEYHQALSTSGFTIINTWGATDSTLNLSPWDDERISQFLANKVGNWAVNPVTTRLAKYLLYRHLDNTPGRLYSILCRK